MANALIIRRRIRTAQNVSKTTRAMQMIAASKLRRAQEAALSSRPYVEKLTHINQSLTGKTGEGYLHPYMASKKISGKTLLIVISPDKGLCGGLITNLLREYLKINGKETFVLTIGKKMEKNVLRLGNEMVATYPLGNTLPSFDIVYSISKIIDDYFLSEKVDSIQILYTHFTSIFSQRPTIKTILPISIPEEEVKSTSFSLFEPNVNELLPNLLKHYLEMVLYQHLLESFVSEQAARMVAMQNANSNAKEIINMLTLDYNKARQEKITNEILDISSGALYA